jgi:hypothetical protein
MVGIGQPVAEDGGATWQQPAAHTPSLGLASNGPSPGRLALRACAALGGEGGRVATNARMQWRWRMEEGVGEWRVRCRGAAWRGAGLGGHCAHRDAASD